MSRAAVTGEKIAKWNAESLKHRSRFPWSCQNRRTERKRGAFGFHRILEALRARNQRDSARSRGGMELRDLFMRGRSEAETNARGLRACQDELGEIAPSNSERECEQVSG